MQDATGSNPEQETATIWIGLEAPAPFDATWELRFGAENRFRVLYEIDEEKKTVNILAIGIKDPNRLMIGTEEFK